MPAPISSLARTLHLMRVEVAQARQQRLEQGKRERSPVVGSAAGATATGGRAVVLQGRLRAARAQPGGLTRSKALRLFVEAALADEWGTSLQLDASFHDLVERTCLALEADSANAELLASALEELDALA